MKIAAVCQIRIMELKKMNISRVGIILLIAVTTLISTNCTYYNRVMSRRNLVDGAEAYKNRKFDQAEEHFRAAIARDPDASSLEGKTAQIFLARTLHSQFIGKRENKQKAIEAIQEYKKVLEKDPTEQSSFKAVANLYENLGMQDEWLAWVTQRANNENVPPEQRADALTSLAARKYSCANEISDVEPVKKTVEKDGKAVFEFTKPEDPQTYQKLQECTQEGLDLINRAVELNPNSDSAWSYKANLLVQKMRIAEMEGNEELKEQYKAQAEEAKERFTTLAEEKRKKEEEAEARKKAEEAANANKK